MKGHKILLAGSTFGGFGGIESYMLALAEYLNRSIKNWQVKVLFKLEQCQTPDKKLQLLAEQSGVPAIFIKKGERQILTEIWHADLIHVQNSSPDIIFPAALFRKPIISTQHNWKRKQFSVRNFLWTLSESLVDRRYYNSQFVRNTWTTGDESFRSLVVPAVSHIEIGMVPFAPRSGFLFLGRWIPNKGLRTLIKAYARAKLDRNNWPLVILGDGPLRNEVTRLIREYSLESVRIPGFVDENRKLEILSHAKWIVAPANTKEDMGLTPIEGRSRGIPSIVSEDGGLPEAGGRAAIICQPGSVESLREAFETAAAMTNENYEKRSRLAFDSLKDYLKPLSFYEQHYLELLSS